MNQHEQNQNNTDVDWSQYDGPVTGNLDDLRVGILDFGNGDEAQEAIAPKLNDPALFAAWIETYRGSGRPAAWRIVPEGWHIEGQRVGVFETREEAEDAAQSAWDEQVEFVPGEGTFWKSPTKVVSVKLTAAQHKDLKDYCKDSSETQSAAIRKALGMLLGWLEDAMPQHGGFRHYGYLTKWEMASLEENIAWSPSVNTPGVEHAVSVNVEADGRVGHIVRVTEKATGKVTYEVHSWIPGKSRRDHDAYINEDGSLHMYRYLDHMQETLAKLAIARKVIARCTA